MKNRLCLLFAMMLFVSGSGYAQETFKLNEKQEVLGSACFTLQAAKDVANGGTDGAADVILLAHFDNGACVIMQAVITPLRKVYQYGKFRVYESRVGSVTVFNPTLSVAEGDKDDGDDGRL